MTQRRVVATWSGGKDSCLACHRAVQAGHEVAFLLNTVSDDYRRVRFHGVEAAVIQRQAEAVRVPLLQAETSGEHYERDFKRAVAPALTQRVDALIFGDVHLEHCRAWAEKVCADLGVEALEPLWGLAPQDALEAFIEAGFEAVVVSTQADRLGAEWLGRKVDRAFLEDIRKVPGVDACGENGEYHTLVVDGPLFQQRLELLRTEPLLRGGYWFLDIQAHALRPAPVSSSVQR